MMMAFGEERENFFDFSFPRVFFYLLFLFLLVKSKGQKK